MALVVRDRVKEMVPAPGTGVISCQGSTPSGYDAFSEWMATNDVAHCIARTQTGRWERFIGTWNATAKTLTRTAVIANSLGTTATVDLDAECEVWITDPASDNPRFLNVWSFGAVGDGVTNDRDAIQRALDAVPASGAVVWFPVGRYLVDRTCFVKSNTSIRGCGAASVIVAVAGANWTTNVDDLTGINTWTNGNVRTVFANENYDAADFTDENISIGDIALDLDTSDSVQRKAGIWMVTASDIDVFNIRSTGGGGVVAFLHTKRTVIRDSFFFDFHSSGADHYSGFEDASVINCWFRQLAVSSKNPAIQFTGTNNNGTSNTSAGAVCLGNTVIITGSYIENVGAISVTAAGSGGVVNNVLIADNTIDCGSRPLGGVICYGGGDNWRVWNNSIANVANYAAINCFPNALGTVTRASISNNRVLDSTRTSGGATLIGCTGDGSSVLHNDVLDCECTTIMAIDGAGSVCSLGSIDNTTYTNAFTLANGATFVGQVSGTWTPSLKFGGGTTGITYSTQSGEYVRLGSMVYLECNIVLTNKGSSTGSATITGIPFNDATGTVPSRLHIRTFVNTTGITEDPLIRVSDNSITLAANARGGAALDNTNFANNTNLVFVGWYRAS